MSIEKIEKLARRYSEIRADLDAAVTGIEDEMAAIRRARIGDVKKLSAEATKRRGALSAAIEAAPELFNRPKSRVFHGIKLGFKKRPGRIEWKDAKAVIERIRKAFPGRTKSLIKSTESLVKAEIAKLSAADCKRIGVEVVDPGDEVFIAPVQGDVERIAEALLEEGSK